MNHIHSLQTTTEYHISSLIVYFDLAQQNQVMAKLKLIEGCEVHSYDDQGKAIVTLEANSQRQLAGAMDCIALVKGVYHHVPVYHEFIDETAVDPSPDNEFADCKNSVNHISQ